MKTFFSVLLLLVAASSASALEWKTQRLSLKAAPLDKTAQTAFEFTNPSDKPVTIRSVDTSCDCLQATASARTIAPGASGRIDARFTLGDRFGTYARTIIVSTDDGQAAAALTVEITVPEAATLTPRVVDWNLHAAATEQAIDLEIASGVDLAVGNVEATSDAFQFRLEAIEPGRRYRLHISPKGTGAVANAAFRIHSRTASAEELVFNAYANVR